MIYTRVLYIHENIVVLIVSDITDIITMSKFYFLLQVFQKWIFQTISEEMNINITENDVDQSALLPSSKKSEEIFISYQPWNR